jgi:hypothetical protein
LYCIRAASLDDTIFSGDLSDPATIAAAAAAGISLSPNGSLSHLPSYMDPTAAAAAAVAAAAATADLSKLSKRGSAARGARKDSEKSQVQDERRELKRNTIEKKEQKHREREAVAARKATERAVREQTREERRKRKLEIRLEREKFAQEQKEAALRRAAELVASNRVPIEITRGAEAAKAVAQAAISPGVTHQLDQPSQPVKKRSAVVVSTARDLHQIVTHANNLWAKYNAIAKEHNQKVNWITVARELGIHVKVREKYSRMHSRAEQRGFDWERNGHWKIKDHPEVRYLRLVYEHHFLSMAHF